MRNLLTAILGLSISLSLFGTAQIPDRLIYNNDTISIYSNPLESFYNAENPRPEDFGLGSCWSTACWRGYQATWELKDNKLFLIEIAGCCLWEKFKITDSVISILKDKLPRESIEEMELLKDREFTSYDFEEVLKKKLGKGSFAKNESLIKKAALVPRRKADLGKLFGENYKDGKVFAFWYTGDIKAPEGKLIEYVHMGYMSVYEKELVLSIENGLLIDAVEYENKTDKIKDGYGLLRATSYSMFAPLVLLDGKEEYLFTMTDTICFSNVDKSTCIEALSKFNRERTTLLTRKILVESTIDSLANNMNNYFMFSDRKTQKLRWGTASWIDGYNEVDNVRIRLLTMSNINSQVIIKYTEKGVSKEDFENMADYITFSVKLMEFGY